MATVSHHVSHHPCSLGDPGAPRLWLHLCHVRSSKPSPHLVEATLSPILPYPRPRPGAAMARV